MCSTHGVNFMEHGARAHMELIVWSTHGVNCIVWSTHGVNCIVWSTHGVNCVEHTWG